MFKIKEFLSDVFLFNGMDKEFVSEALSLIDPIVSNYVRMDEIYSPSSYKRSIGFVYKGECRVERVRHDGSTVPLNVISRGNSFGVVSVFAEEDEYPTKIIATKNTSVIYITKSDLEKLILKFPEISLNIIKFVSKKIIFLNKKVATFSEDSVENKFASFLLEEYTKCGAEFQFNCKRTAEYISAGRASLYRAIALLSEEKIIRLENKKIYILDPQGLERKTK